MSEIIERGEKESQIMSMPMPRHVVIKSIANDKFLRFIHDEGSMHGFLQFTGEDIFSPYSKFEVEMAKSGNGLVHIKSCYNNRYWVRAEPASLYCDAHANEPEEDKSKSSCTLFEPIYLDDAKTTVRFRHVQTGDYARIGSLQPPWEFCMAISSATDQVNDPAWDIFTIIDFQSLVVFPEHVAFKGDNGLYLSAQWIWTNPFLQFGARDIGDPTVGNQVFTNQADGSIRIRSNHFGRFWRRSERLNNDFIWGTSADNSTNDRDTLFVPIRVDVANNIFALRNLGNNNLCRRFTIGPMRSDCLSANVSTISAEARMEVEELVLSREIFNVNYHLMDAKIYDEHVITLVNRQVTNGAQEPSNMSVGFSYVDRTSKTWNSTISVKLGREITMSAGIPLIAQGEVTISTEFRGEYQWGETKETTLTIHTEDNVVVPPMTTVTVRLIATQGTCDVPFSYTQRDLLMTGRHVEYIKDDGMYTGTNSFNIKSHIV